MIEVSASAGVRGKDGLSKDCCVLNGGSGAWAFEPLAMQLSAALGVDVSSEPRGFNYLLHVEDHTQLTAGNFFIPMESIRLASDKRLLAEVFQKHDVPTPMTRLCDTFEEALGWVRSHPGI